MQVLHAMHPEERGAYLDAMALIEEKAYDYEASERQDCDVWCMKLVGPGLRSIAEDCMLKHPKQSLSKKPRKSLRPQSAVHTRLQDHAEREMDQRGDKHARSFMLEADLNRVRQEVTRHSH